MRNLMILSLLCGGVTTGSAQQRTSQPSQAATKMTADQAKSVLDFTMLDIDGHAVPLSKYKGKVLLIVNVASKCGLTPQYEQLQEIYGKYHDRGFMVLGFPANDFRHQEPGDNQQIKAFCTKNYGVSFDMFSKIVVKGEGMHELYKFLTSPKTDPKYAGEIRWNFTKFLIGRSGQIVGRFEPRTKPDAPEVIGAIEKALKAKPD